tara:strand:- start:4289 stop:4669 length:381 start_codon:yes stop_codon:yes gene_type:complete
MTPPHEKPRILTFEKKHMAKQCIDFFNLHHRKYGEYPSLNMEQASTKVTAKSNPNKTDLIVIEEFDDKDCEHVRSMSNMTFMYCYQFGIIQHPYSSTFTMSMSGEEMDYEFNNHLYLQSLERSISH